VTVWVAVTVAVVVTVAVAHAVCVAVTVAVGAARYTVAWAVVVCTRSVVAVRYTVTVGGVARLRERLSGSPVVGPGIAPDSSDGPAARTGVIACRHSSITDPSSCLPGDARSTTP
jgi:hypothetical protein